MITFKEYLKESSVFLYDFLGRRDVISKIKKNQPLGDRRFALELEFSVNQPEFKELVILQMLFGNDDDDPKEFYFNSLYRHLDQDMFRGKHFTDRIINDSTEYAWLYFCLDFDISKIESNISPDMKKKVKQAKDFYRKRLEQKVISIETQLKSLKDFDDYSIEDFLEEILEHTEYSRKYIADEIKSIRVVDYADAVDDNIAMFRILTKNFLKLNWNYDWDDTPAIELDTGPLSMKDIPKLRHDLQVLSKYKVDSNKSAHIHIEKGSNWGAFEDLATILLVDEDIFRKDPEIIGKGRPKTVEWWARSSKKEFFNDIENDGAKYEPLTFSKQKYSSYDSYGGTMLWKDSTNGKTVEFRYPSATLLSNSEQIITNINYFTILVSLARQVNYVLTDNGKNQAVLVLRKNNIAKVIMMDKGQTTIEKEFIDLINSSKDSGIIKKRLAREYNIHI